MNIIWKFTFLLFYASKLFLIMDAYDSLMILFIKHVQTKTKSRIFVFKYRILLFGIQMFGYLSILL